MRVLVVEDERDVADVFIDYLVELGHEARIARSAEDALESLRLARPDAVLLDVHLPGMTGADFLALPAVRESGIPIVAVSGVSTEAQARECLRLGAIDFVGKPLPLERLQEVLAHVEAHIASRSDGVVTGTRSRRHHARAPLTVPVRVAESDGPRWEATSVDVSAGGIRISGRAATRAGSTARLTFTPPDGGTTISVMAQLVRLDLAGYAFSFVKPTVEDTRRLHRLVERFV